MEININELIKPENVSERLQNILEESLTNKISYALNDVVDEQVKKFIEEEITPKVIENLQKNKNKIIEQVQSSIAEILTKLAENMVAHATKNIDSNYYIKDIVKKIFDIY